MAENSEICANCGREIDMTYYLRDEYIYRGRTQTKDKVRIVYYCGRKCRNEANRKAAEEAERKKRAIVEKRLETMKKKKEKKDGI